MAYTLLLEDLARDVQARVTAAGLAAVMGAGQPVASWEQERDLFDAVLAADPDDLADTADRGADAGGEWTGKAIQMRALGMTAG